MKNNLNRILFFGFLALAFASCKDEKDKTPPAIGSVTQPSQNDTLLSGGEMLVKALVTDNEELSQLKIDIHGADDGHTHGKMDASVFWQIVRIVQLGGTSEEIQEHFDVPEDAAAGKYHVILTAVDKAGNQSEFVERDIFIQNSTDLIAPEMSNLSPVEGASYTVGDSVVVSATLTDNVALGKVELKIYRGTDLVSDIDIDLATATYDLNESISSNGWVPGAYTLIVKVYDQVMNVSEKSVNFSVN